MDKNCYLAGKMRGIPLYNFPAFDEATKRLREQGYVVTSPAEGDREVGFNEQTSSLQDFDYIAAVRRDVEGVIANDMLILLPSWEGSKGVAMERAVAEFLGKPVYEYASTESSFELKKL